MTRHAPLVVFGGGGHARAVIDVLRITGRTVAAIASPSVDAVTLSQLPVETQPLATDDEGIALARARGWAAVVAVGDNGTRMSIVADLMNRHVALPVVVARSATVSPRALLGAGTVVMEHAHVGPGAVVGSACLINTRAVIEHDCILGDGTHCAPGSMLGGGASCGSGAFIGMGAAVLPGVALGSGTRVGGGAVVHRSVPEGLVVVGVPARSIGRTDADR